MRATPNIARAHYFHGLVLKDLGAFEPAIVALTRAVQLDSRLIDAERQARALRIARPPRGQPADDKNRGLRGIFGGRYKAPAPQ